MMRSWEGNFTPKSSEADGGCRQPLWLGVSADKEGRRDKKRYIPAFENAY